MFKPGHRDNSLGRRTCMHPAPPCFLFAASAQKTRAWRHKRCSMRASWPLPICVRYDLIHSWIVLPFYQKFVWKPLSAMFAAASKLLDFGGRVTPILLFYFNTMQHVQLYNLMYYMNWKSRVALQQTCNFQQTFNACFQRERCFVVRVCSDECGIIA